MLQAAMECRGVLTVEEGVMITTMESTSVPSGGVGKGDGVLSLLKSYRDYYGV
jgi:hypothetical protein